MPRRLYEIFFALFIILMPFVSSGQGKVDSLLAVVKLGKADTNTVNAYAALCKEYGSGDAEKAIKYGNLGLQLARKTFYYKGAAACMTNIGFIYYSLGEYARAKSYFEKSIEINIPLGNGKEVAYCYNIIGNCYKVEANYPLALQYYFKSLKVCNIIGDRRGSSKCYNNIGIVYHNQKNFPFSLKYLQQSLSISTEMGYYDIAALALVNIGNIYFARDDYDLSLKYYLQSIKISKGTSTETDISSLHNIGNVYTFKNDYARGEEYLLQSLKISKSINSKSWISHTSYALANLYFKSGKTDKAIEYAFQSLNIAREIGASENISNATGVLADCYALKGDYKKAYNYHKRFKEINDSIFNISSANLIKEIETKYQDEKNRKALELLNQKTVNQELIIEKEKEKKRNQLIILLAAFVCIFSAAAYFYFRHKNRQKISFAIAIAEQQKLRFKDVIEAQEMERKRIAEDLHDSVGLMLSTAKLNMTELEDIINYDDPADEEIFKKSIGLIDETYNEVRNISHNMMPGALIERGLIAALNDLIAKINASHRIEIILDDEKFNLQLSESANITAYRIIQEILNNVIKYANASLVNIDISNENNTVTFSVKDNGKGFDKSKIENSGGIGWKNIFSRVTMLNGEIKINSGEDTGTFIQVTFNDNMGN